MKYFIFCKNISTWYNLNAMQILAFFSSLNIKDGLLAASLIMLIVCVSRIRRLKQIIAESAPARLMPVFSLEFILGRDINENGFYLENRSFFLAKNIKVEDVNLCLDDFGYPMKVILRFSGLEWMKAKERVRLELKVFNQKGESLARVAEKILPHLARPSFKISVFYENIEGVQFAARFLKKRAQITSAEITTIETGRSNS